MVDLCLCDDLRAAIEDPWVMLLHSPRIRLCSVINVGGVVVYDAHTLSDPDSDIYGISVDFCPWCGKAFPGDLRSRYFNTIWRFHDPNITAWTPIADRPEDFRTDAWWKKRKIGRTSEVFKKGWKRPPAVRNAVIIGPRWPARRELERPANLVGDEFPAPPGLLRPQGHPPHMCDVMASVFNDMRNMIEYLPHVREYGIRRCVAGIDVDHQPHEIVPIRFCPWCGRRLPKSLRPQWEARLAELGLTPESPDIPEELTTEKWWRG